MLGLKREGSNKKLHDDELHNLHSSSVSIRKKRRTKCVASATQILETETPKARGHSKGVRVDR
jgi:hypothetical protein